MGVLSSGEAKPVRLQLGAIFVTFPRTCNVQSLELWLGLPHSRYSSRRSYAS